MIYIVLAFDGTDEEAPKRRAESREAHLELVAKNSAEGKQILGVAITDDDQKMVGSLMIMNFPSEEALDAWLQEEPYVINDVWDEVEIFNGTLPKQYEHLLKA